MIIGWNPDIWVFIWGYWARAIPWIPTWQGLDGFQKYLGPCALDKSSLSIERVSIMFLVIANSPWLPLELVNPFVPAMPKTALLIWWYLSYKSNLQKLFEAEMFLRNRLSTLLQIFYLLMLNYFQKYHLSEQAMSRRSFGIHGVKKFEHFIWFEIVQMASLSLLLLWLSYNLVIVASIYRIIETEL